MTVDDVVVSLDQNSLLIVVTAYVIAFGLGFIAGQQR